MRPLRSSAVVFGLGFGLALPAALPAARVTKPTPPIVKETFSPAPCPAQPGTTAALVACAQRAVLRTDAQINTRAKVVFGLLGSDAARVRFVRAERAWLAYRVASCTSESDVHEGGSLAAVDFFGCEAGRNIRHVTDLRAFEKALRGP